MSRSRLPWWPLTAVIASGAIVLGVGSADPLGPSLVLGLGALVAADLPIGALLAVLALSSPAAQVLPGSVAALTTASAVSAGLGLGLTARFASRGASLWGGPGAPVTMVWLTLGLSLLMWLPGDMVRLVGPDGGVLLVDVVIQDASQGTRFLRQLPAWTTAASPTGALHASIPWIGCAVLFWILVARASAHVSMERAGWRMIQLLGIGLVAVGVIDGAQLLTGDLALPTTHDLQLGLARLAGSDLSAEVVGALDGGRLGLSSRPMVDLLRVILGGVFVFMGLRALGHAAPAFAQGRAEPMLPVAVGLLGASAFMTPGQTVGLGLAAAVTLLVASWVAGHLMGPRARTPHDLTWGALVVTCFTWLAPVAGWLDPGLGR